MHTRAAAVAGLTLLAGCDGGERRAVAAGERQSDTIQAETSTGTVNADSVFALQVGAFADSVRARSRVDSLAARWSAFVIRATSAADGVGWRVYVFPTSNRLLAQYALAAARNQFPGAMLVRVAPPTGPTIAAHDVVLVNSRTHGMAAEVRWALSPDRRAIVVVEDPVAVEAEPVPNGVVVAHERTGTAIQVDGVWDAIPSPDWRWLAVSWAYTVQGGEGPTIPRSRWEALAGRVPPALRTGVATPAAGLADRLQRASFPVSGMAVASGVGLVQVVHADTFARGVHRLRASMAGLGTVLRLDGAALRWIGADTLAVGVGFRSAQELAGPTRWVAMHRTGDSVAAIRDSSRLARLRWVRGPMLDLRGVHEVRAVSHIEAVPRRFDEREGWITLTENGVSRLVGPGRLLVATATGRFVAALAPSVSDRDRHPTQLIVYRIP